MVKQITWTLWEKLSFLLAASQDYVQAITELYEEHGDTLWWMEGGAPFYVISRPEHVRSILVTNARDIRKGVDYTSKRHGLARFLGTGLVTSEGDFWKRQRKMVAPAFHTMRINNYADTMVHYANEMVETWRDGSQLDVVEEMMAVTLKIIGYTLLNDAQYPGIDKIPQRIARIQEAQRFTTLLPNWLWEPIARFADTKKLLDDFLYPLITERRREGVDHGDILSMLLSVKDGDNRGMTDEEIRDEIVILLFAGHETTANTLNWTFYLLSQYPDVEAKLHQELDQVLGGGIPTLTDLEHLPYTQQVVKEAMRIYPPVPWISREAIRDITVDDFTIPAGSYITIFPWLTHRSADIWEAPLDFRPERFAPENKENIEKWAFYPFGGGMRVCIGNSFALMEAPLVLATVASQYRLRLAPGARVQPQSSVTVYPKYGLPMIAQRRTVTPVTVRPALSKA